VTLGQILSLPQSLGHFGLGFPFCTEASLTSMFPLVARKPAADLILSFFSMATPDLVIPFDLKILANAFLPSV
jgi:hypothetical protein